MINFQPVYDLVNTLIAGVPIFVLLAILGIGLYFAKKSGYFGSPQQTKNSNHNPNSPNQR